LNFLPDVDVRRARFAAASATTTRRCQVKYKGRSIADLSHSPVADALPLLEQHPRISGQKLQTLLDVGLGDVHLGQSASDAFGRGEAQRIKLGRELSKRQTGKNA
jgi:excinuclease ABC subunit A